MSKRRVVVTGMGVVSPIGNTVAENWDALLRGESGIDKIDKFDTEGFSTRIGGQLKDTFSIDGMVNPKDVRRFDNFIIYTLVAAYEAMADAGIEKNPKNADRYAVSIGSGIGGVGLIEKAVHALQVSPRRVSPFIIPGSIVNSAAGMVAVYHGLTGPNFSIATACATGTHSIGYGMRTIQYGDADVVVSGGAEAPITPISLAGFCSVHGLSARNDEPKRASRPWDRDRDGFVLSEGAGILVLEEYEHARKRSAKIYAEIKGFGMSDDAWHITAPPNDGSGAALAMKKALEDGQINADEVSHINAHGTSTQLGDVAEVRAIKGLFGEKPSQLPITSTKSMTGHLLGATGAVEAIYAIKSIQENTIPATINLENPDEGCDLDFVTGEPRPVECKQVMSNSFGFGGTNASLLFSRV